MHLYQPLNNDDIKQLDQFLVSQDILMKSSSFSRIHGLLCAVNSAPNRLSSNQWTSLIFKDKHSFESFEQNDKTLKLLNRFNDVIIHELQQNTLQPLIIENTTLIPYFTAMPLQLGLWCQGYIQGALNDSLWTKNKFALRRLKLFNLYADLRRCYLQMPKKKRMRLYKELSKISYQENLLKLIRYFYNFWIKERES